MQGEMDAPLLTAAAAAGGFGTGRFGDALAVGALEQAVKQCLLGVLAANLVVSDCASQRVLLFLLGCRNLIKLL